MEIIRDAAMNLQSLLQRGRARAGAECGHWGAKFKELRMASTGPRPRGRGMQGQPPADPENDGRLQRGRARAGAE